MWCVSIISKTHIHPSNPTFPLSYSWVYKLTESLIGIAPLTKISKGWKAALQDPNYDVQATPIKDIDMLWRWHSLVNPSSERFEEVIIRWKTEKAFEKVMKHAKLWNDSDPVSGSVMLDLRFVLFGILYRSGLGGLEMWGDRVKYRGKYAYQNHSSPALAGDESSSMGPRRYGGSDNTPTVPGNRATTLGGSMTTMKPNRVDVVV